MTHLSLQVGHQLCTLPGCSSLPINKGASLMCARAGCRPDARGSDRVTA